MPYITREDVRSTLVDMQSFYQELKQVFGNAEMNIEDNLGRRNILMSQVQEEFLARTLSKRYERVVAPLAAPWPPSTARSGSWSTRVPARAGGRLPRGRR